MTLLDLANKKLAIGTVLAHLAIASAAVYLFWGRKKYPKPAEFLGTHALLLVLLVSLAATVSSLFYSNIAGFAPCYLCWWQRIFMYPIVILAGLALIKKDKKIVDYILALAVIGGVISLYHNFIYYYNGGLSAFCDLGAGSVSCIKRYVFEFGYVTIPLMALTAFMLIIILVVFAKLVKE